MVNRLAGLAVVCIALTACGAGDQPPNVGQVPGDPGSPPPATFSPREATALAEAGLATPVTPEAGFRELEGEVGGVSLSYPEDWFLADGMSGQFMILQSFRPAEAGTEGIPNGESKCDLVLRQDVETVEEAEASIGADDTIEVLRDERRLTMRGLEVTVIEAESSRSGRMVIALTAPQNEVVMLSCIGDPEPFGTIVNSMYALE